MFDLVIRGGTVYGADRPPRVTDVGIADGRIVEVGPLPAGAGATGAIEIDATGLVVAPGFIDIHSHGDVTVISDPRARSAIAQGVTTIVVGNCGHSPAPLPIPDAIADLTFGYQESLATPWSSFGGYLDAVGEAGPAVNVASLLGHNAIRVAVLGQSPRESTPAEQLAMVDELDRALDEGAFGLSSGLEYPLGAAAATAELMTLARAVARRSGLYAFHTRGRDIKAVQAFDEAFSIAEETGVAFQISHIAPRRGAPDGALPDVLARLERARSSGIDIACDQHTRFHGITKLTTMLPPSASAVGTDELLRQLRDPAARARFHEFREPIHKMGLMGEWDRLALFEARESPEWVGKDFSVIARERGQHPLDAIMDILIEAGGDAPNVLFVGLVQTQQDLDQTFASAFCSPESDATTLSLDGPLAGQRFLGAYTWAANYLRTAVRERRVLSLEEGIRRLTRMPAERVGLDRRGRLTNGYWADVTVFDPDLVADRASVSNPNVYASGVRAVVVNGKLAFDRCASRLDWGPPGLDRTRAGVDGAFVDEHYGHVLRSVH